MIIYSDIITKDELCSDSFPIVTVDDVVFEINCSMITEGGVKFDIGANPSAEDADGNNNLDQDIPETFIDLVYAMRLEEIPSFNKKEYISYMKEYMKKVKSHLQETNPDRIPAFESGAQAYVKKILKNISDFKVYVGESMDLEGMAILLGYRDDNTTPYAILWKDGLKGVKS